MKLLIVNADDFGKSEAVNQAVVRAHDEGVLTSCSLMVGGDAFAPAVELARSRPRLAVGLHLVLICGKSVLPPSEIPLLVDSEGNFSNDPFTAGIRYQFSKDAQVQLKNEIWAQVEKFAATGLPFSHVDGHLHMHMHPAAFPRLVEAAERFGVRRIRLPREPLLPTLRISRGNLAMKLVWWSVFHLLSRSAVKHLRGRNFVHAERVYGLLETGRMVEKYWLGILPQIEAATNELYCHPEVLAPGGSSDHPLGHEELAALLSPTVRSRLEACGILPATYSDLDHV